MLVLARILVCLPRLDTFRPPPSSRPPTDLCSRKSLDDLIRTSPRRRSAHTHLTYESFVQFLDIDDAVATECIAVLVKDTLKRARALHKAGGAATVTAASRTREREDRLARSRRQWNPTLAGSSNPESGTGHATAAEGLTPLRRQQTDETLAYDAILADAQRQVDAPLPSVHNYFEHFDPAIGLADVLGSADALAYPWAEEDEQRGTGGSGANAAGSGAPARTGTSTRGRAGAGAGAGAEGIDTAWPDFATGSWYEHAGAGLDAFRTAEDRAADDDDSGDSLRGLYDFTPGIPRDALAGTSRNRGARSSRSERQARAARDADDYAMVFGGDTDSTHSGESSPEEEGSDIDVVPLFERNTRRADAAQHALWRAQRLRDSSERRQQREARQTNAVPEAGSTAGGTASSTNTGSSSRFRIIERLEQRRREREQVNDRLRELRDRRGGNAASYEPLSIRHVLAAQNAPMRAQPTPTNAESLSSATALPIVIGRDFSEVPVNVRTSPDNTVRATYPSSHGQEHAQSSLHRSNSIRRSGFHSAPGSGNASYSTAGLSFPFTTRTTDPTTGSPIHSSATTASTSAGPSRLQPRSPFAHDDLFSLRRYQHQSAATPPSPPSGPSVLFGPRFSSDAPAASPPIIPSPRTAMRGISSAASASASASASSRARAALVSDTEASFSRVTSPARTSSFEQHAQQARQAARARREGQDADDVGAHRSSSTSAINERLIGDIRDAVRAHDQYQTLTMSVPLSAPADPEEVSEILGSSSAVAGLAVTGSGTSASTGTTAQQHAESSERLTRAPLISRRSLSGEAPVTQSASMPAPAAQAEERLLSLEEFVNFSGTG